MRERRLDAVVQAGAGTALPWTLGIDGATIAGRESDERIRRIAEGLKRVPGVSFSTPDTADRDVDVVLRRIHTEEYLRFLARASSDLGEGELRLDAEHAAPGVPAETPVFRGVLGLAREGIRTATSAARRLVEGAPSAYAVCRPPGHHAGPSWLGGYCFLNNAAGAAITLLDGGAAGVGVLDLDFHLGNGTSAILAGMDGTFFASVHAAPGDVFPWSAPAPTGECELLVAFEEPPTEKAFVSCVGDCLDRLVDEGCEALVVSVGYDVVAGDPHGSFELGPSALRAVGRTIAARRLPTCFVQEGGYAPAILAACAQELAEGVLEQARVHA